MQLRRTTLYRLIAAGCLLGGLGLAAPRAASAHGVVPLPEPDGYNNIPDSGNCGANLGRWVKFTVIGKAVASGRINSGNPKWTGQFTSDAGHLTIYDVKDQNGNPVLFDSIAGKSQADTRVWQFTMGSTTPLLQAPNDGNFSQFAVCAVSTTPVLPPAYSGTMHGSIYRDYDMDGHHDIESTLSSNTMEPGEAGILVKATDSAGAVWSTTSDSVGDYSFNITGAASTDIRLEYEIPGSKTAFLQLGVGSAAQPSDVIFAHLGDLYIDVPVSDPGEYCGHRTTMRMVASCFKYGDQLTTTQPESVLNSMSYNASTGTPADLMSEALENQIGTTYGLAWNPTTSTLFAGAYERRHAGFGPSGTGAIYAVKNPGSTSRVVSTWANLNTLFGAATAGVDPHPAASVGSSGSKPWYPDRSTAMAAGELAWFHDATSFDAVGKVGFGDIEMTDDGKYLMAVNLADRKVYRMSSTVAPTASTDVSRVSIPLSGSGSTKACAADDTRPMALAFHDGVGYVGVVCSAQSTANRTNLYAYVYSFNPSTMVFTATPVAEFPLNYTRATKPFQPWISTLPTTKDAWGGYIWSSPMFSSIEFDGDDMVFGIRDRFADQIGNWAGDLTASSTTRIWDSWGGRGDVIRACGAPATGWTVEHGSPFSCSTVTTGRSSYGPYGGGLYADYAEYSLGAIAMLSGTQSGAVAGGRLITSYLDPGWSFTNGTLSFSAGGGLSSGQWFTVTQSWDEPWEKGGGRQFETANSLGDLEVLCDKAPIEIGDRLWRDDDLDGLQDPGEAPLPNVRVDLLKNSVLVATTSTDADGRYIFSSGPGVDNSAMKFNLPALLPGSTGLSVKVDLTDTELGGLVPTNYIAGSNINSDLYADGQTATFSTSNVGWHQHNIDGGFIPATTSPAPTRYAIAASVWNDTDGNGIYDLTETARSGVSLQLLDNTGYVMATTISDPSGNYQFDGITPGNYRVKIVSLDSGLRPTVQTAPASGIRVSAFDTTTWISAIAHVGTDPDRPIPPGRGLTKSSRAFMDLDLGIVGPVYSLLPT